MSTITDLIPVLLEKTKQRKLHWQAEGDGGIWLKVASNVVDVQFEASDSRSDRFVFTVRNSEGRVIDREEFHEYDALGADLRILFDTARRSALKVDDEIDNMLKQLAKI